MTEQRAVLQTFSGGVPPIGGHYSPIAECPGGTFYVAGQKAWDRVTGDLVAGSITDQTTLVFENVQSILEAAGYGFEHLTRIQCHLAEIDDYDLSNEVYGKRLGSARPVRTVLSGYELRDGALVELVVEGFCAR